jgi:MarR family
VQQRAANCLGVNRSDLRLLGAIRHAGARSAGALAKSEGLSPSATSTAIQRLVRVGHVERAPMTEQAAARFEQSCRGQGSGAARGTAASIRWRQFSPAFVAPAPATFDRQWGFPTPRSTEGAAIPEHLVGQDGTHAH